MKLFIWDILNIWQLFILKVKIKLFLSGNLFNATFVSIDCFNLGQIKVAELFDRYFKYTHVMLSNMERTRHSWK